MTTIPSAIASLLYDHDTVIVPGLGAFVRHDQSAHVNVITNEFQRPSSTLGFDPQQREENNLVSNYLMACDGLADEEARTTIASFVSECFTSLKETGSVSLPELGNLTMDDQQNLLFEPLAGTNFNGEAFGLVDLCPQPVYGGKPEAGGTVSERLAGDEPLRSEGSSSYHGAPAAEEPSGSEVTVPRRDDPSEGRTRSTWWIWVLLLLLVAAGVALWYFKFRPVPTKPWPLRPVPAMPSRESLLPREPEPVENDTLTTVPSLDTLTTVEPHNTLTTPDEATLEVIVPEPSSKAFIVGGCFSMEKNALNMAAEARAQGCADAFVMKRGKMYYVCYGQYPSTADAKAALPEALSHYNPKSWILTK
jgi:nucleoid DNA-binding protein